MLFKVKLEFDFRDAEIIAKALKPDDLNWAKSRHENGKLIVEIETHKIGALINATEDFFRNIKVSSSVLDALEQS